MSFWWRRRKRWWRGRRRPYYRRRFNYYKQRRRRPHFRRRNRRTFKGRRRRRRKVRRKRQALTVKQWQPDKIVNCKIKGVAVIVLGADGKQFQCYTNNNKTFTPARTPGGGGFGVEKYTLQYLYEEHKFSNNIWTKTNILTDLCRYLGVRWTLYRHADTDFIVQYSRNLPMTINKFTYPNAHPQALLLSRHKKIIPSRATKPHGKNRITFKIKPSKVVLNKWFFQEQFDDTGLCQITAAACNFTYAHLGSTAQNQTISLFSLNLSFYVNGAWGQDSSSWYPHGGFPKTLIYTTAGRSEKITWTVPTTYRQQISYEDGFFKSSWLKATKVEGQTALPLLAFRYLAEIDDGKGNAVWFKSTLKSSYDKPKVDTDFIIEEMPLWQALWGFTDFIKATKEKTILDSYVLLIQCKYILPYAGHATGYYWLPLDSTFIEGKGPYGSPLYSEDKQKWFPTVKVQQESINAIVKAGPYVPKYGYDRKSTWELHGFYTFYFKWGGTFTEEENIADPSRQATYIVPSLIRDSVQIHNPAKQKATTLLHCWDYRRGMLTNTAIKRMCQDTETDTDFQTDAEGHAPPQKKAKTTKELSYPPKENKELQKCLLSLFEEDTWQEPQDQEQMQNLIKKQHQQQQELRYNILKIISDIKQQQQLLQLHTGLIN